MSDRKWRTIRDLRKEPSEDNAEESELLVEGDSDSDAKGSSYASEPIGVQDVLIAFPSSATNRLLRESFENFTHSRVETTTDAVRAFEMALQKPYRVFLFAYEFEQMEGTLLYELICKVYSTGGGPKKIAPGVIFIRENKDVTVSEDWIRDARVKDIISKPIRIDRLLRAVRGILEIHDPTSGE
jgi:CheY-like chemotaxis protein